MAKRRRKLSSYTTKGKARGTCNRKAFAKRLREVKALKPAAKFRPLFKHSIELARHSFSTGYCKRAGRELAHAKKVARY